ncbi:MAG TPA: glycosyltransferase [Candidatus Paceibacterota bacterium]|nr:glycosyltransferase [Candidatus Paceibacterota bacterium]
MRASVIIITRNHSGYLAEALAALSRQDHPDFEVVVVDSSQGEEKVKSEQLAAQFQAKYAFEPRLGQSLARNSGLPHCTGEIVAFTDDDCLPEANWLSLLVSNYSGPEIWGCSGRVIPHRNETAADLFEEVAGQDLGESRRVFRPEEIRFSVALILQNLGKVFAKHMKGKGLAPWCVGHGSSMSFRKAALEELGGFDNRLGAGAPLRSGEDIDINYRILRSGHCLVYEPRAVVRHNHHRMTSEDVFKTRYAYSFGGAALMHENSGNPLMFCMKCGRFLQLFIKIAQYKLTGKQELARVFCEDLRGVRDGIAAQRKNPRDPKLKPAL